MAQLSLYVVTNNFEEYIASLLKLKISIVHKEQKYWSKKSKTPWELHNS
jgi:hypothetical protein